MHGSVYDSGRYAYGKIVDSRFEAETLAVIWRSRDPARVDVEVQASDVFRGKWFAAAYWKEGVDI